MCSTSYLAIGTGIVLLTGALAMIHAIESGVGVIAGGFTFALRRWALGTRGRTGLVVLPRGGWLAFVLYRAWRPTRLFPR